MATLNFKTINDVSQAGFKTVNKDAVVSFGKSVAGILERSHELLKHAAADLDTLKCNQLQNESKLLAVQDELSEKKSDQLEAVKTTVEDKLKSWTDVVKKNCNTTQSAFLGQKKLKEVVKTAIEDSDRSRNVILFNVDEERKESGTSILAYDNTAVQRILYSAGLTSPCEISCERIGLPSQDKLRPLKVTIGSAVPELLSKAKNLKDTEFFRVFIEPGRSRLVEKSELNVTVRNSSRN